MSRRPQAAQSATGLEECFDLSVDLLSIIGFDGGYRRVNASFLRTGLYEAGALLAIRSRHRPGWPDFLP